MSGFSDRRTRDKSLWTFWSLLDCSLFSTSCASLNNFFGEPGMGERLWTNKCLTLDFPMVSPCIIPIKVSHKQAKNMLPSIFMEVRNSQLRTVWYERSRDKKWRHLFRDSAYLVHFLPPIMYARLAHDLWNKETSQIFDGYKKLVSSCLQVVESSCMQMHMYVTSDAMPDQRFEKKGIVLARWFWLNSW